MTVSFFINKNAIHSLNYLDEHIEDVELLAKNSFEIERFNILATGTPLQKDFIKVNIEYKKYDKIKEFLKF